MKHIEETQTDRTRCLDMNRNSALEVRKETEASIKEFRHASLLRRLFPDDAYREMVEAKLALLKSELDAIRVIIELMRSAQIESLRKELNSTVSLYGITIDKEKEKAIRMLISEREKEINRAVLEFAEEHEKAVQNAENELSERVKEFEMKRLDKVIIDFYETIDFFKNEFMRSIKLSLPTDYTHKE